MQLWRILLLARWKLPEKMLILGSLVLCQSQRHKMIIPGMRNMPGKLNGVALAAIGAGSILTWSGIKGWSVIGTIGDVISGKAPNQQAVYPLAAPGAQSSGAQITGATG